MNTVQRAVYGVLLHLGLVLMVCAVAGVAWGRNLSPELAQLLKDSPERVSYAQAGAVILLRERRISVDNDGLSTNTVHLVGKILDEKAKPDYRQIVIGFNSYFSEATLDYARTISQDGIVSEVSPNATQIKTHPDLSRYSDTLLLTFAFTNLKVGSHF